MHSDHDKRRLDVDGREVGPVEEGSQETGGSGQPECCSGWVCTRRFLASPQELRGLLDSTRNRGLRLSRDTVVGEELIKKGAALVRAGRKKKLDPKKPSSGNGLRKLLHRCYEKKRAVHVTLRLAPEPLHHAILLRRPVESICCFLVLVVSFIAAGLIGGIDINDSFESFLESDGPATVKELSFIESTEELGKTVARRRLQEGGWDTKLYRPATVFMTYVAKDGQNLLSEGALREMREVDRNLKKLETYKTLCEIQEPERLNLCKYGISITNAAFASFADSHFAESQIQIDGAGRALLPVSAALDLASRVRIKDVAFPASALDAQVLDLEQGECSDIVPDCAGWADEGHCRAGASGELFMRDFCARACGLCRYRESAAANRSGTRVDVMRSYFAFFTYVATSASSSAEVKEGLTSAKQQWAEFVAEYVFYSKNVTGGNESSAPDTFTLLYGGEGVTSYETLHALQSDSVFAALSYLFVTIYATFHTRSCVVANAGLLFLLLSIPSALSLFLFVSGGTEVHLLSFMSVFIIIGVGSDMIFVYNSHWQESKEFSLDPAERIGILYKQAGLATAATSFTTASSFLANLRSSLLPLRQFGFFMGMCVVFAWFNLFVMLPPLLLAHERRLRDIRFRVEHVKQKLEHQEEVSEEDDEDDEDETRSSMRGSLRRSSQGSLGSLGHRFTVNMVDVNSPTPTSLKQLQAHLAARAPGVLRFLRWPIVIFFTTCGVLAGYYAISGGKAASGTPQIFGSSHNQERLKEYGGRFNAFDPTVFDDIEQVATSCRNLFTSCEIYHCQSSGRSVGNDSRCQCFWETDVSPSCSTLDIETRVAIPHGYNVKGPSSEDLQAWAQEAFPTASQISVNNGSNEETPSLISDHWESGRQTEATLVRTPKVDVQLPSPRWLCSARQICFCGMERCDSNGAASGHLNISNGGVVLRGSESRRMDDAQMADYGFVESSMSSVDQAEVRVVFGMKVLNESFLLGRPSEKRFSFIHNFEIQDPWVQRKMLQMCEKWPKKLLVVSQTCWIIGFKSWWFAEDPSHEFPVRPEAGNMHELVRTYASNYQTNNFLTETFMWWGLNDRVKATYISVRIAVSRFADANKALELNALWEQHMREYDESAPSLRSPWQTSPLWSRAQGEQAVVKSTFESLLISVVLVLMGVIAFTQNLHLAFIVFVFVIQIMCCLLYFMVIMMDWGIGALEVLSLIVFIGFTVDYNVHVAHKYHSCHVTSVRETAVSSEEAQGGSVVVNVDDKRYTRRISTASDGRSQSRGSRLSAREAGLLVKNRSAERFERTKYALSGMGESIIGSTISTCGCVAFMLPCELYVFAKIGLVVLVSTGLAALFALIPLTAALMAMGPCQQDVANLVARCKRLHDEILEDDDLDNEPEFRSDDEEEEPRMYVLNMPNRGMGNMGPPGNHATRNRIGAGG